MAKRFFVKENKVYTSMMDIARELGIKRVYPKDFDKYDIKEITEDEAKSFTSQPSDDTTEEVNNADEVPFPEEPIDPADAGITPEEAGIVKEETKKTVNKVRKGSDEDIQFAVDSVKTKTIVEFNNIIKKFDIEALIKMAEEVGVNTWEKIENNAIRRMRLLMEIKTYYYPNDKVPVKKSTPWSKVPLDRMIELANENSVEFSINSDNRVQRMLVTVALNKAGFQPEVVDDTVKAIKQEV